MIALIASFAITGATVFTGEGPPLENATVVVVGNRVTAVGQDVEVPERARVIDAAGAVVTPGLVDANVRLGVEEFNRNVPQSVEATAGSDWDPVRAALRVADTYDPRSLTIPVARGGGDTSALVVPRGGVVSGQSIWVDLVGDEPVRRRAAALHVSLRAQGDKPGSRTRAFLQLREAFEDARLYRANRGPFIARKLRDLSVSAADLDALARALERELKVVIEVDRAADILSALRLSREHRIEVVLLGVREGWLVADEIAKAGVPVLVDPLENLPSSYDALHSRSDNAARLHAAGVVVGFTMRGETHLVHRLRFAAGNAVAEGMPYEQALAAITSVPAEMFGIADAGALRPGALANIVIWNGDPLEVTSWPTHLFIRGREIPIESRQDLLTQRYR